MSRTILHSDMNCFYASVEMLHHPELAGKPMAVGGDPEARHGIVLTANYIAKRAGVKTGMALWQARQVCNIIRSQHNSMSCLRITTDCHWLSGKFRMMQFVIRKSAFFHIILSDCLKYPFRNLFFLLFCITHIVFESLPSFSCDP